MEYIVLHKVNSGEFRFDIFKSIGVSFVELDELCKLEFVVEVYHIMKVKNGEVINRQKFK